MCLNPMNPLRLKPRTLPPAPYATPSYKEPEYTTAAYVAPVCVFLLRLRRVSSFDAFTLLLMAYRYNCTSEWHFNFYVISIHPDDLIIVGIGKRICLGEPLGQDRMFLFVAFLVKTFEFQVRPQRIAFNAGTQKHANINQRMYWQKS